MKVLYITFINFDDVSSGSSVRPQRIYKAFCKLGYEVKLVSGKDMFRRGNEYRKKCIQEVHSWLDANRPDYCYVENSTSPVKLFGNWKLLKRVHNMGVPIGYFYRDFYYKFPVSLGHGMLKDILYKILYARDERNIRKYADILYLPSERCFDFFEHRKKVALPPGVDIPVQIINNNSRCCIYVGGVSEIYGTFMLVEAFRIINVNRERDEMIRLKLVCRRSDLELLESEYIRSIQETEWIEIMHAEGEELKHLFTEAEVGLIPILKSYYSRQAIPIKISDYISNGLPIISTPLEAEMDFFGDSKVCRFSADDSPREYANEIVRFFESVEYREESRNSLKSFADGNMWEDRIHQLEEDLLG